MKNLTTAVLCLLGALTFVSCNSGTEEEQDVNGVEVATVAGLETLTPEKRELLVFASRNNLLQIELGRIAVEQGATEEVRVFGQQLIDWYTSKQLELQEMAAEYDVPVPQDLEQEQLEHLEEIRTEDAQGLEFDDEYWDTLIAAQKDAIDKYENNVDDVEDANASAFSLWARNTLKELRAQLVQAEAFELELENQGEAGISNSI